MSELPVSENANTPSTYIPRDIVTDILSRVRTTKSLLRFKLVSNFWLSLISDPHLAKLHLNHNNKSKKLFICNLFSLDPESDEIAAIPRQIPITRPSVRSNFDSVGSCNGLICSVFDTDHFAVWNPTTTQVRELPSPPPSAHQGKLVYGFGYDISHDDYKVLRGSFSDLPNPKGYRGKIEVFNLRGNSWRTIEDYHCSGVFLGAGAFLNGCLHWLMRGEVDQIWELVRFDIAEEKFLKVVALPTLIDRDNLLLGNICVIADTLWVYTQCYAPYFGAWRMQSYEDPEDWQNVYNLGNGHFPTCEFWLKFLHLTRNGEFLFDCDGAELHLCPTAGPGDGVRELDLPRDHDYVEEMVFTLYEESLLSPYFAEDVPALGDADLG